MGRTINWELPTLAPFQKEWLDDPHRFKILECATGTGKTTIYEPHMFQSAHAPRLKNGEYWWVAPTVDQAKAVFFNIVNMIEEAGATDLYPSNKSSREIVCPGGGILCFQTGENPDNLFGDRRVCEIVVDEFTRCRMKLWEALISVANKNSSPITLLGNFRGTDTEWHIWIKEVIKLPEFKYFNNTALDALDAGIMKLSDFNVAKGSMTKSAFDALYLCQGSADPTMLVDLAAIADLWWNEHIIEDDEHAYLTCDIALQGSDRFVIGLWKGMVLVDIEVHTKRDSNEVVDIIKGKAVAHNVPRSRIAYDADGLGAYLTGYLQGAVAYHGGKAMKPVMGQKLAYQNTRSQCHFMAADAINGRKMRVADHRHKQELDQEIQACLRSGHVGSDGVFVPGQDAAGRWGIVPKDKPVVGARARLNRSPDLFDIIPMRMYLELAPMPIFTGAAAEIAESRRVKYRTRKPPDRNVFKGR